MEKENLYNNEKIVLRPGTPDDLNRDYLPEEIVGTDIVVNESGNNSQPYPKNLKEYREDLTGRGENVWYEYVPDSYNPSEKCALVISLHGGIMTGWGQAVYTSWTLMADRDGFIVVFPDASVNRGWQMPKGKWEWDPSLPGGREEAMVPEWVVVPSDNLDENQDIQMLFCLIERMKSKYNIDAGRIFMQGMSMGDAMSSFFARNFGYVLAGVAGSGTAAYLSLLYDEHGHIKNSGGALAVWQSRPERNRAPELLARELRVNKYNRLYWMKINECEEIPEISIMGENNIAYYKGKKADLVYRDIKHRDHGQTFDDAALIWDYLFSGIRRNEEGEIVSIKAKKEWKKDDFALAFAEGCTNVWTADGIVQMDVPAMKWKKLKYHGLNGEAKVRGEYWCVPLSFLAEVFKLRYIADENAYTAEVYFNDGRCAQFARGSIGCVVDDTVWSMYCEAVSRDGELYVSTEWFCRYLLRLYVSSCGHVVYITDHFSEISIFMADLIEDILKGKAVPDELQREVYS